MSWDIHAANQVLEDAGYLDTDGDGVREMPAGSLTLDSPRFRYYVRTSDQSSSTRPLRVRMARPDRHQGGRAGHHVRNDSATSSTTGRTTCSTGDGCPTPIPDSVLADFTCDERPPDGTTYGNNDSYYCNPEYDRLLASSALELDPAGRWELIHQAQKIFYEDAAYAVMWYTPSLQAYRTDRSPATAAAGPPGDAAGRVRPADPVLAVRPFRAAQGGEGASARARRRGVRRVWLGIVAGLVIVVGAVVMLLRRRVGRGRGVAAAGPEPGCGEPRCAHRVPAGRSFRPC